MTDTDLSWDILDLGNGKRILRADVPKSLQIEFDRARTPADRARVCEKILKHVHPASIIGKDGGGPLSKSTFSQSSNATSGNTNYSIEGDDRWLKHWMHVGGGDHVLRSVGSEDLPPV